MKAGLALISLVLFTLPTSALFVNPLLKYMHANSQPKATPTAPAAPIHLTTSLFAPNKYAHQNHSVHVRETFFSVVANCLNEAISVVHILYEHPNCPALVARINTMVRRAVPQPEDLGSLPEIRCYPYDHQPTYFEMLTHPFQLHTYTGFVSVVANTDIVFDNTIQSLESVRAKQGVLLTVNSGPRMEACFHSETHTHLKLLQEHHQEYLSSNSTVCISEKRGSYRSTVRTLYRTFVNASQLRSCEVQEEAYGTQWCRHPEAISWDAIAVFVPPIELDFTPLYRWTSNSSLIPNSPIYMNQPAAEYRARCGLERMGFTFRSACNDVLVSHWHCGRGKMHHADTAALMPGTMLFKTFRECRAISTMKGERNSSFSQLKP